MTWHLFLDESGDLGFDFREKHPSKFLTISVLAMSSTNARKAVSLAVKKTLRRKVNKPRAKSHKQELKGSETAFQIKSYFYEQIKAQTFGVYAMSINKRNVHQELRRNTLTKSRLYNYLARKVLEQIPFEKADGAVELIVDKSKGNREIADFNQYLLGQLQGRLDPRASLNIYHRRSNVDLGLSAADLFCWGVFRKRESADRAWYDLFQEKVRLDEQYL
ncbi:MAG: DUF3800 domain-containing protein [Pirellulales bacterium]